MPQTEELKSRRQRFKGTGEGPPGSRSDYFPHPHLTRIRRNNRYGERQGKPISNAGSQISTGRVWQSIQSTQTDARHTLRVPPVSGPPSLDRKSWSFLSNFCCLRRRITASGLLMERVKLVSGNSARKIERDKTKHKRRCQSCVSWVVEKTAPVVPTIPARADCIINVCHRGRHQAIYGRLVPKFSLSLFKARPASTSALTANDRPTGSASRLDTKGKWRTS